MSRSNYKPPEDIIYINGKMRFRSICKFCSTSEATTTILYNHGYRNSCQECKDKRYKWGMDKFKKAVSSKSLHEEPKEFTVEEFIVGEFTPVDICKYCGKFFHKRNEKHILCSQSCRSKDPDVKEKVKLWHKNKKLANPRPVYIKVCVICGKEFETKTKLKIYCSKNCVCKKYQKKHPKRKNNKCIVCGKVGKKGVHKYCSKECRESIPFPIKTKAIKQCCVCSKEFSTFSLTNDTCSRKCYKRKRRQDPEIREMENNKQRIRTINHKEKGTYKKYKPNKNTKEFKLNRKLSRIKYEKRIKRSTPKWISQKSFKDIVEQKKECQHIDHIIPINHPEVCGLNVPWNLQLLNGKANEFKSNKFDGTYENKSWVKEYRKCVGEKRKRREKKSKF